jgi:hypothetical protein
VTDGAGTIALVPGVGVIRTIDAATGRATDTDVSSSCTSPPAVITGVGGGQVLFECSRPHTSSSGPPTRFEPRLLDVATRAVHEPVGTAAMIDDWDSATFGSVHFGGIGSAGIGWDGYAYHGGGSGALDPRTGAVVGEPQVANEVTDLNAPGLVTTLCAPIVRKPYEYADEGSGEPSFDPLQYEAPYALQDGPEPSLTLQRCGSTRAIVLAATTPHGVPQERAAELAAGFVSWAGAAPGDLPLYVYEPACSVKLRWLVSSNTSVGHLTGGIVVSETFSGGGSTWRVRRISLDGTCRRVTAAARVGVSSDGRRTTSTARSGTIMDAPSGATATMPAPTSAVPRIALRAGRFLTLATGASARGVRWKLGDGRWRSATGRKTSWRLRVPRSRAAHTLTLSLRFTAGGSARFDLRVPRTEG